MDVTLGRNNSLHVEIRGGGEREREREKWKGRKLRRYKARQTLTDCSTAMKQYERERKPNNEDQFEMN